MNICSPQLGLSPKSSLGGEVFDREILLGLAKKGLKIEIILPKGLAHDTDKKNLSFTFIPIAHFPAFLFNILIIPYLFKVNRKNKIDIIRLHQPQFVGIGAVFFKLFHPGVKLVATYHQFRESSFGPLSGFLNNYWDSIICDSFAVLEKLHQSYGVSKSKIEVVHNGVPLYLKPEKSDEKVLTSLNLKNKKVLLFMGLFVPRKNPLFLIEVLANLVKSDPSTVLVYWGKGSLKNQIIEKAQRMGIADNIRFVNPIFGKEKNKIHNIADVFVHPSLDEGFALAPLEAMACGKPVIMNDSHSAREAIENNYNGLICKTGDPKSWTTAIDYLLNDKVKIKAMGENSLKKVKKEFNWDESVKQHEKVFKQLISC